MSSFIQDTRSPAGWGGWCASGLVALSLGGLAAAWTSPRETVDTAPVPRAPSLTARSLERAPLVQIRRIGAGMDHPNCLESHDPRIPCAMYAPGYRPKSATEDYLPKSTGGNDLSANFVVRDPNWKWPQPGGK
ncbi:MAG TPA: hypothetical protein VFG20_17755, partial [Planctomycetaceae bacterium]|nr:hypothetical protein [Planctomycetaceae bacterium]